jgi:hypothetical protein
VLIENIRNVGVLFCLNNGCTSRKVITPDFVSKSEVVFVTLVSLLEINKRVG